MTALCCHKNYKFKKKTLLAQITFNDLILTLADITSDLNSAISLILVGELTFGLTSLLMIWLPGLLMIVWMTFRCFFAETITWTQLLWLSILCGPLFPFWVIGSYIKAIWHRNDPAVFDSQYALSVFFKAIEAFAEAAPQLLLNVYILLVRWTFCWDQILSMCFSIISLTKTASENHFIELRALKPGLTKILTVAPFFMFHIIYRICIFGTLTVYLKTFIIPVFVLVVAVNIQGSRKLLHTHSICTFWTAISSPFSCSAFKHIENGISEGPGILDLPETLDFYLWNTVSMVSITSIALVSLSLMLKTEVLSLGNLGVTMSPIFSCGSNNSSNETIYNNTNPVTFLRECSPDEGAHDLLTYYVLPVFLGIGVLSVVFVFSVWFIARKDSKWVNAKIKTRTTGEVLRIRVRVSEKPGWLAAGPAWRQGWCQDTEGDKAKVRTGWRQAMQKTILSTAKNENNHLDVKEQETIFSTANNESNHVDVKQQETNLSTAKNESNHVDEKEQETIFSTANNESIHVDVKEQENILSTAKNESNHVDVKEQEEKTN